MPYTDVYLYSPLSTQTVRHGEGPPLLLQFILSELFQCADVGKEEDSLEFIFSTPACFFPFDWSYEVGCLNKIEEHAQLLPHAFDGMTRETHDFQTILEAILLEVIERKKLQYPVPHEELMEALCELYEKLTPFLIACKQSENLVLFLLKHAEKIDAFSKAQGVEYLLGQMVQDGNFDELLNRYDLRGFSSRRAEFDTLIASYGKH